MGLQVVGLGGYLRGGGGVLSGGVLSGVLNEELDWAAATAANADANADGGTGTGATPANAAAIHGLLACETESHNFVLATIRPCFRARNAMRSDGSTLVDLAGLSEKIKGFGGSFGGEGLR